MSSLASSHPLAGGPWRAPLVTLALVAVAMLVAYHETYASLAILWWESETYNHGFVIVPICAYLIYQKRAALRPLEPGPSVLGLICVAVTAFLWLVSHAISFQLGQQLAAVSMVAAVTFAVLGRPVTREILFPLGYLMFAVPMGETLIPSLQSFTAWFSVMALRASGVAVFWEGDYFNTSAGSFEVAKACSGVRYLITAVALGFVYAYLTYRTLWRRLVFIAVSAVVPILANGVRVYGIVLLAHATDMQWAIGVDHLIYGWIFFGVVMALLFWAGQSIREPAVAPAGESPQPEPAPRPVAGARSGQVALSIGVVVAVIVAPLWAAWAREGYQRAPAPEISLPALNGWEGPLPASTRWSPVFETPAAEHLGRYQRMGVRYHLYVVRYDEQHQGAELIRDGNRFFDRRGWKLLHGGEHRVQTPSAGTLAVGEVAMQSLKGEDLLLWHWYRVDGRTTASRVRAKLYELMAFFRASAKPAYGIAVTVDVVDSTANTRELLAEFVRHLGEALPEVGESR